MWALLMGLMLILVALGTADSPGVHRAHAALTLAARALQRGSSGPTSVYAPPLPGRHGRREAFANPSHLDEPALKRGA